MNAAHVFDLRGGGQVTRRFLPFAVELDALYPDRFLLAETATGTAWCGGATEANGLLLILDERQNQVNRPEQSPDELVTVLGFKPIVVDGEPDQITIDVFVKVVSALIHESAERKMGREPDGGVGGTPVAPPAPPLWTNVLTPRPMPEVPFVMQKVFKA